MIVPKLKNDALLKDIDDAKSDQEAFHLWWLGQSGYLIQWQNKHLLIDPYLSDSLTKKYAATDKPHIRMTELVIDPRQLDFINFATSSHNHTDHLDAETLIPLIAVNPGLKLIIPEANRHYVAERLKIEAASLLGLVEGQSVTVDGFKFTAVPAAHEKIERDEEGRARFLGYVIHFGRWTIYHSGDTVLYESMPETFAPFSTDLALLPINGRAPERRVAGNLNAGEALSLAKMIGAKVVIPCHYDMFTFNTADPREFEKEAFARGQQYRILQCGERWSSHDLDR